MKRNLYFIISIFFISLTLISCSEKIVSGKYQTNFNIYGMFSRTLTLECNGNAILNFRGDLQNNNSFGNWKTDKDTLVIFFDSVKNRNNKYQGELKFLIKRNKLENPPFPKKKYYELVESLKKTGNDTLKILSYRKLNKMMNQNMKNHYGKIRKQYFKKIEFIECK